VAPIDVQTRLAEHLPLGYRLRSRFEGEDAGGFPGSPDQLALIYTRGLGSDEAVYPLLVYVAARGGAKELVGTEGRSGSSVDIGVSGVTAVYHDGMWAPGPGPDERRLGELIIHWDTGDAHSITVSGGGRLLGVRGARSRGVLARHLVTVARSLL
jgi:hypothetical protein